MASTATYGPLHAALAARDPAIFDAAVNCASAARCARFNACFSVMSAAIVKLLAASQSRSSHPALQTPDRRCRRCRGGICHRLLRSTPGCTKRPPRRRSGRKLRRRTLRMLATRCDMAASCMHDRHLLMMVLLTCVSRVGTPCLASHRGLQIPNDAASKSTCDSRHCACRSARRLTTPWHMARTRCRKSASGAHASHRMQRPLPLTPRTKQVGNSELIIPPTCLV